MAEDSKPRLLFLRFTSRALPSFITLHLEQQVNCLSQFFDVTVVNELHVDYRRLCKIHQPDIAIFESGVYVVPRRVENVSAFPEITKLGFLHCDAFCPTRKLAHSMTWHDGGSRLTSQILYLSDTTHPRLLRTSLSGPILLTPLCIVTTEG